MRTQPIRQILLLSCAAVLIIACCVGAIVLAANVFRNHTMARAETPNGPSYLDILAGNEQFNVTHAEYSYLNGDTPVEIVDDGLRISDATTIVFESFYLDGAVERTEEPSPHFMLGMTRANVEETFAEWTVADFTDNKLVMRRYMDFASENHYIVGVYDGYVAVFYGFGENNGSLMRVTRTSTTVLPQDEVERLHEGIRIIGTDKLIRVLQDYGS